MSQGAATSSTSAAGLGNAREEEAELTQRSHVRPEEAELTQRSHVRAEHPGSRR
jgi:hypothetical protein